MSIGAFLYYLILAFWSAGISYAVLKAFGKGTAAAAHAPTPHAVPTPAPKPHAPRPLGTEPPRSYSSHEGFRSFRRGSELTVDDIVTGLSRE